MLGRGETVGVFQLEGGRMRKALADSRLDRFDDLVALVVKFADRGFNKAMPRLLRCLFIGQRF